MDAGICVRSHLAYIEMEEVMANLLPLSLLDDRCVYVRTAKGQRHAAADSGLGGTEKSLLLMANGHSQLRILIDKLPAASDFAQSVKNLYDRGLIELVEPIVTQDSEYQLSSWPSLDVVGRV
jgi:hypothetical protein